MVMEKLDRHIWNAKQLPSIVEINKEIFTPSYILSSISFRNSLLFGLPKSEIHVNKLKTDKLCYSAVRVIITRSCNTLHWLPVH